MKTAETKTGTQSLQRKKGNEPFFGEAAKDSFFSKESKGSKPFFSPATIQPKLTIGQPGDKYEQEADAMAEKVVQTMSNRSVQRECADCAAEEQENALAPKLQPKAIFESNEEQPIQKKCTACQEGSIQPKYIQMQGGPSTASPDLESRLSATSGSGSPLPKDTRSSMESAIGADFSSVRVHTGQSAVQMNQELGAQAFTHGSDVYFNSGKYDTNSSRGQRLLAHELTHVVQQGAHEKISLKTEEEKIADAKSDLVTSYQLKSVVDGDTKWKLPELEHVKKALKKIPAADKAALKNLILKRVLDLGGKTAGKFSTKQNLDATTNQITDIATLELDNKAFNSPNPELTIVHEVGHAVASLSNRNAFRKELLAMKSFNEKVKVSNAAGTALNTANAAVKVKVDEYNAKVAEVNAKSKEHNAEKDTAKRKELKKEYDQLNEALAAIKKELDALRKKRDELERDYKKKEAETKAAETTLNQKKALVKRTSISTASLAAIKRKLVAAKAKHDRNLATAKKAAELLEVKQKTESSAYQSAVDAVSTALANMETQTAGQSKSESEVEALVKEINQKIANKTKEKDALNKANKNNKAHGIFNAVEQAQDDYFYAVKSHALAKLRHLRVQKFVEFVERKKIAPITPYAAENWPHKAEEFYAEAYSYWLNGKLKSISKDLHNWFQAGNYK